MSIGQLWREDLVHSRVWVKFWKVPCEDIPTCREALTGWLWEQWVEVNDFVEETAQADHFPPAAHALSLQPE